MSPATILTRYNRSVVCIHVVVYQLYSGNVQRAIIALITAAKTAPFHTLQAIVIPCAGAVWQHTN